jgi:ATP-dependent DNA helicase RecQ
VLRGDDTENVRRWGHEKLTTYGLLANYQKNDVRNWLHQLIGQGALAQEDIVLPSGNLVPILKLNEASWEVMRGQRAVRLLQPVRRKKGAKAQKAEVDTSAWEGVDEELFETLRTLRRQLAEERRVPAYIIFSDSVLRQLARVRPSSLANMRMISGIGDAKLRDVGAQFLEALDAQCSARNLARDNTHAAPPSKEPSANFSRPNAQRDRAFELFRQGKTLDEVSDKTDRARLTLREYLCEFIRRERPKSLAPWISEDVYERVASAARQVGIARLKPIFIALGEQVPYDAISVVVADLQARQNNPGQA